MTSKIFAHLAAILLLLCTQGLQQHMERLRYESDAGVLSMMCESHKGQLQTMRANHARIKDRLNTMRIAKQNFGNHLHPRIRFAAMIYPGCIEPEHVLTVFTCMYTYICVMQEP